MKRRFPGFQQLSQRERSDRIRWRFTNIRRGYPSISSTKWGCAKAREFAKVAGERKSGSKAHPGPKKPGHYRKRSSTTRSKELITDNRTSTGDCRADAATNESRGYYLKVICADLVAGTSQAGQHETSLPSVTMNCTFVRSLCNETPKSATASLNRGEANPSGHACESGF